MSQPISGHVSRYDGTRRSVWRAKYRLPDGRQVKKTLGPAWTSRGRPPAGYYTKRTAEAWLRRTLAEAAAGTIARGGWAGAAPGGGRARDPPPNPKEPPRQPPPPPGP